MKDPSGWSPLVERALRVAVQAHQGQTRKATGLSYISHPVAVAMLLQQHGFDDEQTLAAALLHDVVEDTPVTMEQLAEQFPAAVTDLVAHLTETKQGEDGHKRPWEDRKREHLAHIQTAPTAARAIVLADKLHNLSTMAYDIDAGEDLSDRFNATLERIIWYYGSMISASADGCEALNSLEQAARTALRTVQEHCGHVPKC